MGNVTFTVDVGAKLAVEAAAAVIKISSAWTSDMIIRRRRIAQQT